MTNLLILQDLIKAFEAVTKSYNISKKDAEKYIKIIESTETAVIEYATKGATPTQRIKLKRELLKYIEKKFKIYGVKKNNIPFTRVQMCFGIAKICQNNVKFLPFLSQTAKPNFWQAWQQYSGWHLAGKNFSEECQRKNNITYKDVFGVSVYDWGVNNGA